MLGHEILEHQKCMLTARTLVWSSINDLSSVPTEGNIHPTTGHEGHRGSRVTAVLFLY